MRLPFIIAFVGLCMFSVQAQQTSRTEAPASQSAIEKDDSVRKLEEKIKRAEDRYAQRSRDIEALRSNEKIREEEYLQRKAELETEVKEFREKAVEKRRLVRSEAETRNPK